MKTIGVVTTSRADYGIYRPILEKIQSQRQFKLQLFVSGTHLSRKFGRTITAIEKDGFPIAARIPIPVDSDSPQDMARSMGRCTQGFAQALARLPKLRRPDIVLVLGDRYEMFAAAAAIVPFNIPLAHLHGGESTYGAIDENFRHAITKLSHLHFVATQEYARRVMQLGEETWRVIVSGAPSLDHLRTLERLDRRALEARYGLRLEPEPLLVTFHPVTLEYEQTEWQAAELLAALRAFERPIVFTLPNADTNGRVIIRMIETFVREHPNARLIENLGTQHYFSMMFCAAAMVGNSSSGIVEAPSFGLPVVNIGTRQQGRLRAANVVDVGYPREAITQGIAQALAPDFRARLRHLTNPYGDGHAAVVIVRRLKETPLDLRLIQKQFVDFSSTPERWSEPQVAAHAR